MNSEGVWLAMIQISDHDEKMSGFVIGCVQCMFQTGDQSKVAGRLVSAYFLLPPLERSHHQQLHYPQPHWHFELQTRCWMFDVLSLSWNAVG